MQDFIRINENDNVAVALRPIAKGEQLTVGQYNVTTQEDIPQGHKFALKPIEQGSEVIKYGFRIGYTKEAVPAGGWVHVHNLKTALGDPRSDPQRDLDHPDRWLCQQHRTGT